MIQIDKSRCVGCGLCVRDCFPGALSLEEHRAVLTAKESCIGCGHCIGVCPKNALGDDRLPMDDVQPVGVPVPPEELLSMMRSRRSCRHYQKKPVPEELLAKCLLPTVSEMVEDSMRSSKLFHNPQAPGESHAPEPEAAPASRGARAL